MQRILDLIRQSQADTLAVGVGSPKQEHVILKVRDDLPQVRLYFGIGQTIDLMAGATQRAPLWMQRAGMEWAFRLSQEPGRLAKRYLLEDLPFFRLLWQQKRGHYQNPWSLFLREIYIVKIPLIPVLTGSFDNVDIPQIIWNSLKLNRKSIASPGAICVVLGQVLNLLLSFTSLIMDHLRLYLPERSVI